MNNDPDHHMWYASIHLHSTHTAPYKYLTKNENKIISQEIKKNLISLPGCEARSRLSRCRGLLRLAGLGS